jgi:hypothetical protein
MKLPSLLSIKKPCQDFDRSCKDPDRSKRFGKAPADVNAIPSKLLKPTAKLVLYAMAEESKGTSRDVRLSDTVIAQRCGISRPAVIAGLRQLGGLGLIEKRGVPVKQIQAYRICHPMFSAGRAPKPVEQPAAKAKVDGVSCPKCGKQRPALLRVGWCRSCNWHIKIVRVVDERIAAAAEMRKSA